MLRFADPFADIERMFHGTGNVRGGLMPMDAFEKDGMYTLRFDLPGVDPDRIDLTVENGSITVTAERAFEDTDGANWLVRERPTGMHSRQIRVSEAFDTGSVNASYDEGVLTVTIPLREEAKPQKVRIESNRREAIGAGA